MGMKLINVRLWETEKVIICHRFPPNCTREWGLFCGEFSDVQHKHCILYRARRAEARIQQMLWKVNYSDIVFMNTVCVTPLDLQGCKIYTIAYNRAHHSVTALCCGLLTICHPSGCTVVSGVVGVVVVVVCNHSQKRTSKRTCLIFGVSIA